MGTLREADDELKLASKLAKATEDVQVPEGTHVVIFVFTDDPASGNLFSAYISTMALPTVRRWAREWLHATRSDATTKSITH